VQLKLADLRNGRIERSTFKAELKKQLPTNAYFYSSPYLIAYQALRLIKDIRLRKTSKSVSDKSKEVLLEFFNSVDESDNLAHVFVINILELFVLPIVYKQNLELLVKRDLAQIEVLLDYYHSLDFIKERRTRNSPPRNHEQKTIFRILRPNN
jgi:hypothetical protein